MGTIHQTYFAHIQTPTYDLLLGSNVRKRKHDRVRGGGGGGKNTYELLNRRAFKFSPVDKISIFQYMGKIFCVEIQRYPLKFHTKYVTPILKNMSSIQHWTFKSSYAFLNPPINIHMCTEAKYSLVY